MRIHQTFVAALPAILLMIHSFSALAADQLPQPDPEGTWRVITQDPATTTSKCIGDTSTPVCAMETELACYLRSYSKICLPNQAVKELGYDTTYYRIDGMRRILTDEVYFTDDNPEDFRRAGEVEIFGHVLVCKKGDCDFERVQIAYFLTRKKSNIWEIIHRCINPCD